MISSYGEDVQSRKYGDKEFVSAFGLDEYDSEARWYYPAIMRTTTMDPLCEKYYSISPYAWRGNNPVNCIDPDGRTFSNQQSRQLGMQLLKEQMMQSYEISQQLAACQDRRMSENLSADEAQQLDIAIRELQARKEAASTGIAAIVSLDLDSENLYRYEMNKDLGSENFVAKIGEEVIIVYDSKGTAAHESVHILQSLRQGGLSFNEEALLKNANPDYKGALRNEAEAYRVQFTTWGVPFPVHKGSILYINENWVYNLRLPDGTYPYRRKE